MSADTLCFSQHHKTHLRTPGHNGTDHYIISCKKEKEKYVTLGKKKKEKKKKKKKKKTCAHSLPHPDRKIKKIKIIIR